MTNRFVRAAAIIGLLGSAFATALWMPLPTVADGGRQELASEIKTRLPGWEVERIRPSWEGAYSVVARCAREELAFMFVPGHGLPVGDAWLQPSNATSRERLAELSDHWRLLIWYEDPAMTHSLNCAEIAANDAPTRGSD